MAARYGKAIAKATTELLGGRVNPGRAENEEDDEDLPVDEYEKPVELGFQDLRHRGSNKL